ncbi:MAG: carboxypeptidase regulatory-like domain-containing protein [Cyanobacteria bacterium J06581_3]
MKQTLLHSKLLMLAAVVGVAAIPTRAMAHQVQTNYFINEQAGDRLELRTTFSNGQPLKNAKVTVYAPDQPFQARAIGQTDSQGRFTFTPDGQIDGDWEVNIERGGHQDILTVPVTEEGIDMNQVASTGLIDQGGSDFHYASSPWAAVGSVAVAIAAIGLAKARKKPVNR